MSTAEQFLRNFLSEREALHRKYHDSPPVEEKIESVSTPGSFAIAITKVVGINAKMRYRLRPAKESWMIEEWKTSCGRCGGTGKKPDTDETCPKCDGAGWIGFR